MRAPLDACGAALTGCDCPTSSRWQVRVAVLRGVMGEKVDFLVDFSLHAPGQDLAHSVEWRSQAWPQQGWLWPKSLSDVD